MSLFGDKRETTNGRIRIGKTPKTCFQSFFFIIHSFIMNEVKDQNIFIKEEINCKEALLERVSNSTRDSFIDFSSHSGARQMRLPSVS